MENMENNTKEINKNVNGDNMENKNIKKGDNMENNTKTNTKETTIKNNIGDNMTNNTKTTTIKNMENMENNTNIKINLKNELKTISSYEDSIKIYDKYISDIQLKLGSADPLDVAKLANDLTYVLNQKTNYIKLQSTKKALKDTSIFDLKNLLITGEYKKMKITKSDIENLIEIKEIQAKKETLKEFEILKTISSNINGNTVEDAGLIIKKSNKIGLISFDFLNLVFDTKDYSINVYDNHSLCYSKNNGNHVQNMYQFIKEYLEKKGFTGFIDSKKLTYSKSYNYLRNMEINKETKEVTFNIKDNNFFENPKLE